MSYRDILARSERRRPDGSPVWPLRASDIGLLSGASVVSPPPRRPSASGFEATTALTGESTGG